MPASPHTPSDLQPPLGQDFANECAEVLLRLRGALIESMALVGADASRPREAARKLGLDKTLIWKVSKIIGQTDAFPAVNHVPGRAGCELLCKALRSHGADEPIVARIERALHDFEQLVDRHAGDRATLQLVAGGYGPLDHRRDALEQARKLAFRGNAGVWSVRARTQMTATIMAPNADDPKLVDLAQVYGLMNLSRLRPDVSWIVGRSQSFEDDENVAHPSLGEPFDSATPPRGYPVIREFSSNPLPDIEMRNLGDEVQFQLRPGRVGRTGEITTVQGSIYRAVGSQYADGRNRYAQLGLSVTTPVEHLHFDLFVHKSMTWAMQPEVALYGRLDGRIVHVGMGDDGARLPLTESVVDLGRGLSATPTPSMPRHSELLRWMFTRTGWNADDFHAFRFEMAHPPMPTYVVLYSELMARE